MSNERNAEIPTSLVIEIQFAKLVNVIGLLITSGTVFYCFYLLLYTDESLMLPSIIGTGLGFSVSFFSKTLAEDVLKQIEKMQYEEDND